MKKSKILILVISSILVVSFAIFVFYYLAFDKANNLIASANKGTQINFKCTSNYKVYKSNSDIILEEVTNREFNISMQYKDFKWVVVSVSSVK